MSEEVPRLDLAPKLNRPLQLWNPLDYLRLLYWIFYFPQALRWYEETFVAPEHRGAKSRTFLHAFKENSVLRHFVLQALILCFLTALSLAWAMEQLGLQIDWISLNFGVVFGMAVNFGLDLGRSERGTKRGAFLLVAESVLFGISIGMAYAVAKSMGIFTAVIIFVVAAFFMSKGMYIGMGVGMEKYAFSSVIEDVLFNMVFGATLGLIFSIAVGVAVGMTEGMAACVVYAFVVLRLDAWTIATLLSFFSYTRSMTIFTAFPLPGLRGRLKYWLRNDWSEGVYNLNELLKHSMQFIPVVQALNDSLAEHPAECLLPMVDEVAKDSNDWDVLRYSSAPLVNRLKMEAIDIIPIFSRSWKHRLKARYPTDLRLDTPARAVCAGFWHLHKEQPIQAAQAFAVVRSLPNGEEMRSLSQLLYLALSVKDFQSIANLAGEDELSKVSNRPSEPLLLHPETWLALEHLQRCALEALAVQKRASKASRSWALNRAIGEVVAVQKMVGTIPQTERALVEEIAKSWQSILVSESAEVGSISIYEPVKNPYVAGDPVVGPGFKGREDTIRELKQLWCGTTKPPSVVLYGHRRMGKTSILRNINSHLGSEVRLAYVNLLILGGAERGLSDLFLAIADEIRASLPELPQADMDEFDRHPELAFKQYLDLVQSALGKSRLIIALDEFEKLEEWMNAGRIPGNLLDTFRGYIQKDQNIAFAFAGLHKLEEMTEDYFNPLFASVRPIRVSFLSKDAAFQVLANPALEDYPLDFSREALECIWQLTGGQPYLVQLVGHYLVSRFNRLTFEQGKQLEPVFSLEDVEAVIADPEFYSQGRYYFAGIWGQAGQGAEGQKELLKFIAAFPNGIPMEGIAARFGPNSENTASALRELERHDVLQEKDGQWQFTVELMRRWVKEFR